MALALTAATMVMGVEIKGARRWIALPGMSVQPSEFLKPCFAIVAAWLISEGHRTPRFPGKLLAIGVFGMIALLLKSQPDIGMLAVITAVFFAQLYVDGLNLILVGIALMGFGAGGVGAYMFFSHVQKRVQTFLHPDTGVLGSDYQPHTALEAFGNGGLLGRGPGEGRVKDILPDAHADFVFAVAGEEFGMIVCLVIIGVFAFIVLRGLLRLLQGAGSVHRAVLHRAGHRLWPAGVRQHGIVAAADPDQGDDTAVHFLWRFVGHRRSRWAWACCWR